MRANSDTIDVSLTTDRCRYCLMCRHVCPVADVTRSEAASPHGWGLLIASVERQLIGWTEETVDLLYQCADCGLCRSHCATDQPLPLAINASRAAVVEQQLAPAAVYELQQKLQRWQNPYVEIAPAKVSRQGKDALLVGAIGYHFQAGTIAAATQLLTRAGIDPVPVALGRESAYLANSLGLSDEARQLAQATLAEIEAVGTERVFVLSPGDIYTAQTLFEFLGLTWPAQVQLVEVTAFLADRLTAGQLTFEAAELSDYTFYDPDHTVRVPGRWNAPRRLLAAISPTPPIELFWRKERAAPCGASGGLPFTQPELSSQLAQARLAEAQARGIKTIITDDPQVLHHLQPYGADRGLIIDSLLELLARQVK